MDIVGEATLNYRCVVIYRRYYMKTSRRSRLGELFGEEIKNFANRQLRDQLTVNGRLANLFTLRYYLQRQLLHN